MKTMFLLVLLAAVFLGGYYLGRQPDSPDIFGWAQTTYQKVSTAGEQLAALIKSQAPADADGTERSRQHARQ